MTLMIGDLRQIKHTRMISSACCSSANCTSKHLKSFHDGLKIKKDKIVMIIGECYTFIPGAIFVLFDGYRGWISVEDLT
jgi:hypothetical protein